jgi:hypothetical protein
MASSWRLLLTMTGTSSPSSEAIRSWMALATTVAEPDAVKTTLPLCR